MVYKGGFIGSDLENTGKVPQSAAIPFSMKLYAKIYATPLDSVIDALVALIRNPSGCFE